MFFLLYLLFSNPHYWHKYKQSNFELWLILNRYFFGFFTWNYIQIFLLRITRISTRSQTTENGIETKGLRTLFLIRNLSFRFQLRDPFQIRKFFYINTNFPAYKLCYMKICCGEKSHGLYVTSFERSRNCRSYGIIARLLDYRRVARLTQVFMNAAG